MDRRAARGRWWALALVSLLAGVAAQELAVRLALPDYDPNQHMRFVPATADRPVLGPPNATRRLVKNSGDYNVLVRFNRHGLRDDKDIATATADDLLMVGDSFVFGWGVERDERLSDQLAERLHRRVFNLGSPEDLEGYGKLIRWVQSMGRPVGKVILAVNMGNDLVAYPPPDGADSAASPVPALAPPPPPSAPFGLRDVKEYLTAHSGLYFLATTLVHRSEGLRHVAEALGLIVPMADLAARVPDARALDASADWLAAFARRHDLTVLLIPARGLWSGDSTAALRQVHEDFAARLRARNLDVVDPLAALERGGAPLSYYFANDGHWNPTGHALAADLLARHLQAGAR
ncbi:MAG: hypothetical protein KDE22_18865 [Rhodobacterales bacterium]|nr:hypothetical protein [Rhodobacterales bacterium]